MKNKVCMNFYIPKNQSLQNSIISEILTEMKLLLMKTVIFLENLHPSFIKINLHLYTKIFFEVFRVISNDIEITILNFQPLHHV